MKLSIVIICWNDLKVIVNCLESIFKETQTIDFEVIVSDNGSSDASVATIRAQFPSVKIVENQENLGFAKGNNSGIQVAQGKYILVLNPDTIILDRALEKLVEFAEARPDAGAFGCRVLNPDGSFQNPARPIPTVLGYLVAALCVRKLARFSKRFESDIYIDWEGREERNIGFQSGCCVMFRHDLLSRIGVFDERFFYHFEETDLCFRVWKSGSSVGYFPGAEITHLGGQSVGRLPIRFALETCRSGYRFFEKHYGAKGLCRIRWVYLVHYWTRFVGYKTINLIKSSELIETRLQLLRVLIDWNWQLEPARFIASGEEPEVGFAPMAPPASPVQVN